MNQLAGALVGKHVGPVLVCGGAPCLPADLEVLRHGGFDLANAVIVSGNEHAVHAGMAPDYISVNDDVHTVLNTHQEPRMRKLAPYAKLLSRHWWGDYRHPKMIKANSGITGLLWAGIMGANPIIAAGFELYRGKGCYFHSNGGTMSPSMQRPDMFMLRQVEELKKLLQHTPLRAVSGPLAQHFGKWDPAEKFPPRELTRLEQDLQAELPDARYFCASDADMAWDGAVMPRGVPFAVTAQEARNAPGGFVDTTGREPDEVMLEQAAKARAAHHRYLDMVSKVRRSQRGVRSGIYDSDIIRIIRQVEEGRALLEISRQCGLPKEQIAFLIKTTGAKDETRQGVGHDVVPVQHTADGAAPH